MKSYDEIRDIIVNHLGITDIQSYEKWANRFCWVGNGPMAYPRQPTQEDVDLLSPDNIDNNAFWRIAEELFQTDPVSNCQGKTPYSIEQANRQNLGIYHTDGFTGMAEALKTSWSPTRAPMLEIGPGYGAFKEWVAKLDYYDYYAADVYPRIPGVDATELNGLLASVTLGRKYAFVLASNVFQHLSVHQRNVYYSDISRCLLPTGVFMVSMMLDDESPNGFRDKDGKWWCRHYGQLTRLQTKTEIMRDLERFFIVDDYTIAHRGGWIIVKCQKPNGERKPFNNA